MPARPARVVCGLPALDDLLLAYSDETVYQYEFIQHMHWNYISAMGAIEMTGTVCAGITLWLAFTGSSRRALEWIGLFGTAMLLVVASKIAFIGWGIGVMSLDFAGFSGHAARAGAVFPVAAFLLSSPARRKMRTVSIAAACLLASLIAISRVQLDAHSSSEAVLGLALGLATAGVFITIADSTYEVSPRPWLLLAAVLPLTVVPIKTRFDSQQFITSMALALAGTDQPFSRDNWQPVPYP